MKKNLVEPNDKNKKKKKIAPSLSPERISVNGCVYFFWKFLCKNNTQTEANDTNSSEPF